MSAQPEPDLPDFLVANPAPHLNVPIPSQPANPLYDAWAGLVETVHDGHWSRYEYRSEREWFARGPDRAIADYPTDWRRRHDLTRQYAWAVPSPGALARIAALSPIIEIGAGTGYWASLLAKLGADVLAIDLKPPCADGSLRENDWHKGSAQHFPVRYGGAPEAGKHPERTLMLCWPPYQSPMAVNALRAYEQAGGQRLVYIGEGYGGCCADDAFFHRLGEDRWRDDEDDPIDPAEVPWQETASLELPQWPGLNDRLTIYERRA